MTRESSYCTVTFIETVKLFEISVSDITPKLLPNGCGVKAIAIVSPGLYGRVIAKAIVGCEAAGCPVAGELRRTGVGKDVVTTELARGIKVDVWERCKMVTKAEVSKKLTHAK